MNKMYPMAHITAPGIVEFRDKKLPRLGEHDVLVGVRAAAICGSDLHIFKGKHPSAPLPVSIGHEIAGDILETGTMVSRIHPGERVTVEPVITCGHCDFCRRGQYHLCVEISFQYRRGQGGFAPYFVVPEDRVFPLPNCLSYEEGTLVEPLAVALHAVKNSGLRIGESTAIFGVGAIGLLLLMISRLVSGAQTYVVDLQDFRLEKALELGASQAFNGLKIDVVEEILKMNMGKGVDCSFEAAGVQATLIQALKVLKKGGRATLLGIFENPEVCIPVNLFVQREIVLAGSQGYNWDFQDGLALLEQGRLDLKPLITHRIQLEDLQEGFELFNSLENKAIKVIVSDLGYSP